MNRILSILLALCVASFGQGSNQSVDLSTGKVIGILPSTKGGTGINNAGTLTLASNVAITGGGTLALGGFTLTTAGTASVSGTNTGDQTSVTGNAGTATALQTARTINGVSFNGTANITIPVGDVSLAGDNAFTGTNTFGAVETPLSVTTATVSDQHSTLSISASQSSIFCFGDAGASYGAVSVGQSGSVAILGYSALGNAQLDVFGNEITLRNVGGTGIINVSIGGGTSASELRFLEPSGSGVHYTGFKAPALAGNVIYTMPIADGTSGQVVSTNASGALSWVTRAGLTANSFTGTQTVTVAAAAVLTGVMSDSTNTVANATSALTLRNIDGTANNCVKIGLNANDTGATARNAALITAQVTARAAASVTADLVFGTANAATVDSKAILTSAGLLVLGPSTAKTTGFPALKRNAATFEDRLGDDSGFAARQSLYERFGAGDPESVVTAPVGAIYHRTDGGAGTSLYVKESGTGNTGWIPK